MPRGSQARARFAHVSQLPHEFCPVHDETNCFRGMEFGCKYAEAFIDHVQSPDLNLPQWQDTDPCGGSPTVRSQATGGA